MFPRCPHGAWGRNPEESSFCTSTWTSPPGDLPCSPWLTRARYLHFTIMHCLWSSQHFSYWNMLTYFTCLSSTCPLPTLKHFLSVLYFQCIQVSPRINKQLVNWGRKESEKKKASKGRRKRDQKRKKGDEMTVEEIISSSEKEVNSWCWESGPTENGKKINTPGSRLWARSHL